MAKDWTGNYNSVFKTLGSSHHTDHDRQLYDYYATEPRAALLLLDVEQFHHDIWDCDNEVLDFLDITNTHWQGDIITNPPYKYAREFVEKALSIIPDGYKVAMFLKLQFLEGKSRKHLFATYPPKCIYVSSSRLNCAINGNFDGLRTSGGSAVAYAWYVWEKGYKGNTIVKWIN